MSAMRGGDGTAHRIWVQPERPDQSPKALAMGWRHRYRGGLIMLRADPPLDHPDGVVETRAIAAPDNRSTYKCRYADDQIVWLEESDFVHPDELALNEAIAAVGRGPSATPMAHIFDVLRSSYVWVTAGASESGAIAWGGDRTYGGWLFAVYRFGREAAALRDAPATPAIVFSDLDRAEQSHEARGRRAIAVRVPFVVACGVAEAFGGSERILFNPGSEPVAALDRETYRLIPGSVAGYDITVRRLPAGGLDPAWLDPIRVAVRARPEVRAAYGWRAARASSSGWPLEIVNCLGLTMAVGHDDAAFAGVRGAIREHAAALGLRTDRTYLVTDVSDDTPWAADTVNVIRIKG